jgi:hypothetical protein
MVVDLSDSGSEVYKDRFSAYLTGGYATAPSGHVMQIMREVAVDALSLTPLSLTPYRVKPHAIAPVGGLAADVVRVSDGEVVCTCPDEGRAELVCYALNLLGDRRGQ